MTMLMSPFGKGEVRRTGGYLIFVVKILRLFEPPPLHKGGQNAHKIRHSEHSEESYDVPKMFRFAQYDKIKKESDPFPKLYNVEFNNHPLVIPYHPYSLHILGKNPE